MLSYTKDEIQAHAGAKSYDRGVDYIENVSDLVADDMSATATVHGSRRYEVYLEIDGGLDGECDCPWGQEGNFCKHCVAVALLLLYHAEHGTLVLEPGPEPSTLDVYLASLDNDALVELLQDAAERDPALRQRLERRALADQAGRGGVDGIRRAIDLLLQVDNYIDYQEAWDYASQVEEVTRRLADLYDAGRGTAVVSLAQHALAAVAEQYGYVDDSSGVVGGAAADLAALHSRVCADVRPDPHELASWLLAFQTGDHVWQEIAVADYQPALGPAGMASYGEQLTSRWREGPTGDRDYRHYHLHYLLQAWASACQDTDLLVSLLSSPEPYGIQYGRIAEVLTEAGRSAEALEWAERGLADWPNGAAGARPADSLVDFVASRYAEAGRTADVLTVRRDHFARTRSLHSYQQLRDAALAADPAGELGGWPAIRSEVLALLRAQVLVDVLLWEGAGDEAWEAAQRDDASPQQWLRLAETRAQTHPADAITVYQRLINERVELRQRHAYHEAADLAVRVKQLHTRLGQERQFASYLAGLRRSHKPKRNFMAALDERGL